MHLDPDYIQVEVGDEFEVDILISDVSDLYGIELTLEFDPVILQVVDIDTSRSGIQMALGDFPYPDFVALNEVDNLYGRVSYGCSQVGQAPVSGSGTTLTVRFEATKAGATALTIQDVLAANQNAIELPTEVSSGEVLVVESDDPPAPPTDPPNETIPAVPTTQAPTRTPLPTHTSPSYLPSATPNAGYPGATPPPTAAPAPTTNTGGYPAPTAAPPPGPATARPSATSMPTNTVVLAPTRQGETPAGGGPSPTVAASVATAVATSDAVSESPATLRAGFPTRHRRCQQTRQMRRARLRPEPRSRQVRRQ